jgi:hypothetical protein
VVGDALPALEATLRSRQDKTCLVLFEALSWSNNHLQHAAGDVFVTGIPRKPKQAPFSRVAAA